MKIYDIDGRIIVGNFLANALDGVDGCYTIDDMERWCKLVYDTFSGCLNINYSIAELRKATGLYPNSEIVLRDGEYLLEYSSSLKKPNLEEVNSIFFKEDRQLINECSKEFFDLYYEKQNNESKCLIRSKKR